MRGGASPQISSRSRKASLSFLSKSPFLRYEDTAKAKRSAVRQADASMTANSLRKVLSFFTFYGDEVQTGFRKEILFMVDILFVIALAILIFLGQIAVEIIKGFIQVKFTEKKVKAAIDTAFSAVGNIGLQRLLDKRKGSGSDEV